MTPLLRRIALLILLALPFTLVLDAAAQLDGAAPEPVRSEPTATQIRRALRHYRHEPTIRQLLDAIATDPTIDPERARELARRARRGGWLPTLRVGARRGQQRDLSQSGGETDPDVSTDDDLTLDGSLTFRFDRAAYGPDEVSLAREERSRALERQERARTVVAAYFERRRLQLERDLGGSTDVGVELRILELEALLDAFTGGAFSRLSRGGRPAD